MNKDFDFSELITFSRTSTGYYVGSDGKLKIAASGEPRFDSVKGFLLEGAATNSLTYSNDLANSAWTKTSCTATFGVEGPMGPLQYGPELVTNGTNFINATGWTSVNSVLSTSNGALVVSDAGSYSQAYQSVTTEVGSTYEIRVTRSATGGGLPQWGYGSAQPSGSSFGTTIVTTVGNTTQTVYFVASATTTYISVGSDNTFSASYSLISIRKVANGAATTLTATTLTATANNALAYQAVAGSAVQRVASAWVRRRTGSGAVSLLAGFGNQLLANPEFDTDTIWNKGNVSISDGAANFPGSGGAAYVDQNVALSAGKVYAVTHTIEVTSGGSGVSCFVGGVNGPIYTTSGTRTDVVVSGATTVAGMTTRGAHNFAGKVLSVSIVEIYTTALALSSSFQRFPTPAFTAANPIVGFKIATSGDEIDVAYCQLEQGSQATSSIYTASVEVTRTADLATVYLPTVCDILIQDGSGATWNDGVPSGTYTLTPRAGSLGIKKFRAFHAGTLSSQQKSDLGVAV